MMSRTGLASPKQSVLRIMTDAADLTGSVVHDRSIMCLTGCSKHSACPDCMLAGMH